MARLQPGTVVDDIMHRLADLKKYDGGGTSLPTDPSAPEIVKKYLNFGASVRGIQNIILAAKARALMQRRYHVAFEDVAAMAKLVLWALASSIW